MRSQSHPHTQACRKIMQCRGSCECLHRSQNSHYWHSCLYPRSTKRGYKNNEVQQAQNKKRVSAVNSMECLTQESVLIFLSTQNVLMSLTTLKKILGPAAKWLDYITNFNYFTNCLCIRKVYMISNKLIMITTLRLKTEMKLTWAACEPSFFF